MKLLDYFQSTHIVVDPPSSSKEELFRAMLQGFANEFGEDVRDEALRNLLAREETSPTGCGNAVAIPHALVSTPKLTATQVFVAVSHEGIDYKSADNCPVNVVYLVVSPKSAQRFQVRVLARLMRLFKAERFVERLKAANSSQEILEMIKDEDKSHF